MKLFKRHCGIYAIFNSIKYPYTLKLETMSRTHRLKHRGPNQSGVRIVKSSPFYHAFGHTRLAIVDPESGPQPFYKDNCYLTINGEIFNHEDLRCDDYNYSTKSDCEVILSLYKKHGVKFLDKLDGMFAFVLYDNTNKRVFAARDHIGINPLYIGETADGEVVFASELKAIHDICVFVKHFPPGHYYENGEFHVWYRPTYLCKKQQDIPCNGIIHDTLVGTVQNQLMADVPWGVLLSGGLDSSIIAAIARAQSQIKTFSVGIEGSPDVSNARVVAEYLKTDHTEINFSVEEAIKAVEEVIYHIETYDITTVRASVPMYLMAKHINKAGIKMVLSGEGADELFGGYLYFHKAPNHYEFHKELIRKLDLLHKYDCLRANKAMLAFGIETRVPFLGKDFINMAMSIHPSFKMCDSKKYKIEKDLLRKTFNDYLPKSVINRQKEQFSDGVGYDWIDALGKHAEDNITDIMMHTVENRFPYNPPVTKEGYWYRDIFEGHFASSALSTVRSTPSAACSTETALEWDKSLKNDPSGRTVSDVHQ